MDTFDVRAHWDAEAQVWWADSDQIPGLATEAATLEQLDENVRLIAPELLRLNIGAVDTARCPGAASPFPATSAVVVWRTQY
jgi:hypothetical protein